MANTILCIASASVMTYIVSSGALNSTHSLILCIAKFHTICIIQQREIELKPSGFCILSQVLNAELALKFCVSSTLTCQRRWTRKLSLRTCTSVTH